MKTLIKATLASLSTIVIHFLFEIVGTLIANGKEIYSLLRPLSWQTMPDYLAVFVIQSISFVLTYLIIGKALPGNRILTKGILFGFIIYLLSGLAAIAPMVFVFKQGLSLSEVLQIGFFGALIISIIMGIAFVAIWENIYKQNY